MGILQARILEWVAKPSSRESFQPRDWTQVSHIAGRFFTIWATREAHSVPLVMSCDTMCETLSTRKAHQRLCLKFFLRLVISTPCWACTNISEARRKARVQDKPYCSTNNSGTVSHYSPLGNVATLLKSKFTNISQRPTLQTGSSKDKSLKFVMLTLSCTFIDPYITSYNFH